MKTFTITYTVNSTKFKGLNFEVEANSEREAVENYYQMVMDSNYFPEDDGRILDQDGDEIASATSSTISYDGGSFVAEERNPRFAN
jgi:hypothetical protein